MPPIINVQDLPRTQNAHELVGAEHGVPVSLILVNAPPGSGPALHRHPYAEVFVIEHGVATIRVDDAELTAQGGQIVIAPANSLHGFTNRGREELRLTAIHTADRFDTEWAGEPDTAWASPTT
jgi:mannose-6-phosphate isomerase-like protein (cupin superfamily)